MRKLILFLCLALAEGLPLFGQAAKDCFKAMPDSLLPLLTEVNRADFIDFLESGMRAEVTNRFGRKSEMTTMSADYIRIQLTERGTWQMKLLPLNDSVKVVCVVSTAYGPVADSDVYFYTPSWQELDGASFLQLPSKEDFLAIPDSLEDNRIRPALARMDMTLLSAELSAQSDTLTMTFHTPRLLDKETAEVVRPFIRPVRKYVWRDGGYRPVTSL